MAFILYMLRDKKVKTLVDGCKVISIAPVKKAKNNEHTLYLTSNRWPTGVTAHPSLSPSLETCTEGLCSTCSHTGLPALIFSSTTGYTHSH